MMIFQRIIIHSSGMNSSFPQNWLDFPTFQYDLDTGVIGLKCFLHQEHKLMDYYSFMVTLKFPQDKRRTTETLAFRTN